VPASSDTIYAATPYYLFAVTDTAEIIQSLLPQDTYRYFPLAVGNRWYHNYSGTSCEITCTDFYGSSIVRASRETILDNGKKYVVLEYFDDHDSERPYEIEYLRLDSARARVYKYDESNEPAEFLLFDFAMTPNDSLTEKDNYEEPYSLIATEENQDSVFSDMVSVKAFERYDLSMPYMRFSKGIGKFYEESSFDFGWSYLNLKGAVINGVVYGDTLLVGIEEEEQTQPSTITLQQNYPNPFNPSTTIVYELPRREQVKIEIFDSAGRKVATLVDTPQNPGRHELSFNAAHLASGVYYYRLKAGQFVQTEKMLLIK